MSDIIYRKITKANNLYSLFSPDSKVLVALSGGADSVALLVSLKEYFPALDVYACHVNHMLRGDEADRDCEFAVKLCKDKNIHIEVLKTDVAAYATESGMSTELAARKVRYAFFEDVCAKHGINLVATAHTLSDNAETVLFNLTRGTALDGLCGIPPKRQLTENIALIRPLILVSRSEIEEYLSERNQKYVTDSSNLTDDYTRNIFRHRIVPELKKINPSLEESIGNTCASLRETQIFIDKTANNSITDDVFVLGNLDDCLLHRTIIMLYKKSTGKTLLENVHITAISAQIKKACKNKSGKRIEICLPDKISAIIDGGRLSFCPTVRKSQDEECNSYRIALSMGENVITGTGFSVFVCKNECQPIVPDGYTLYDSTVLDASLIQGELYVRNRASGDTVANCGMTKKIKELFIHKKIPAGERNALPFVCDSLGILYVPKTAICDRHKKAGASENNKLRIFIYYSGTPS